MDPETDLQYCSECAMLESSLQNTAAELRQVDNVYSGTTEYFRQTARLLLKRNRNLEELAAHQRIGHLKAS